MPDRGYHRGRPTGTWVATAAVVVEILSPDDETYEKFDFYAGHGVDEVLVADPSSRVVTCWRRQPAGGYEQAPARALLAVTGAELAAATAWPDEVG